MRRVVEMCVRLGVVVVLGACGGATTPTTSEVPTEAPEPRHAGLVDREVLRSVTGRASGASDAALGHARTEAVRLVAIQVDALTAEEVSGLRLDLSIAELSITPSTIRARALISVSTAGPPERMHAILQAAGTVQRGSSEREDTDLAIGGAVQGALRRLSQVLAQTR